MDPKLLIAALAFTSSFLGCFQVLNLAHNRRKLAGATSCCIAVCQLHIYKLAPTVEGVLGTTAYVLGGLFGAQLAMCIRKNV